MTPTGAVARVMGILNATPDSFSDGGQYLGFESAVARGLELWSQGADIVDVGGESTRPGAARVPVAEEASRVIPVIRELAGAGVTVSVDTMNSETALQAAEAGATIINDVSGGLADPAMYGVVADTGLTYIAMHWRGVAADGMPWTHGNDPKQLASYGDVVTDVRTELQERLAALAGAGVDPDKVVLDPGLGFAKSAEHNWQLLARLTEIESLGHPVLIGASRKRFLAPFAPDGAPAADRDLASAVVAALAANGGVWGVRVHDVAATRAALGIVTHWQQGSGA
jgi:dihydropteroate synthase